MALGTISSGTVVYASTSSLTGFNDLRLGIQQILTTGYGASVTSSPVNKGDLIAALSWTALADDFQRIQVHQTASTQTFTAGYPQAGSTSLAVGLANELSSATNLAYINSATVAASQLGSESITSSRTNSWVGAITHEVTHTWPGAGSARTYFNLGGYLTTQLSRVVPASPGADDLAWGSLIATAATRLSNLSYDWTEYTGSTATLYAYWNGTTAVWTGTQNTIAVNPSRNDSVSFAVGRNSTSVVTTMTFTLGTPATINVDVTSTVTNYYSRGDVAVGGYYGIAAPRPATQTTKDLTTGGNVPITPPSTKILAVSALSTFNSIVNTASAGQTVTLTNNGNTALTITGITYTENGGAVAVGSYWSPPIFPKTISSGTSASYTLAYQGPNTGTFYNSFTINSDNDAGPVTIQTTQVIAAPAFTFTLSPASWTTTLTTPDIVEQKFTIVPNDGSTVGTNYTYSWASGVTTGFTISQTPDGPTVSFNPNLVSNGAHAPTLSVIYNGVTKTAAISITTNLPSSYHLGHWTSAIQNNNAVAGISYDVIGGQRYLTLGFSIGADGAPSTVSDPSYAGYISTSSLSVSADTKYSSGMVVYGITYNPAHCQFLTDYGVWPRSNSIEPINVWMARTYKFTVPSAESYTWVMSVDNFGYFTIDGVVIGDMRGFSRPYSYTISDVIDLSQGDRTLTFNVYNASGGGGSNPGAIAIQIYRTSDNLEVWNSKTAVRSTPAYQYWQEVYRIPINVDGVASTYYSKDWIIKDYNATNDHNYGYYLGSGNSLESMFTVANDGFGALDITFNFMDTRLLDNVDLYGVSYLPYYYSEATYKGTLMRVTNLESNAGDGLTTFLQGFNQNGTVKTTRSSIPTLNLGSGGGGGGCPDPDTDILLPGNLTKRAGDLQVGDLILTIHDITAELGEFAIASTEIVEQPKVLITLDDNSQVKVSDTHRFLTRPNPNTDTGLWKKVSDLAIGDKIQTINSKLVKEVVSIENIGLGPVVKLEVEEAHTYVANTLISHNVKNIPATEFVDIVF